MATSKPISLHSSGAVARSLDYCYDAEHESHAEYRIARDGYGDPAKFVTEIRRALVVLNEEADRGHQFKVHGHWLIARWPDGTHLNAAERDRIRESLVAALCKDLHRYAWHVHRTSGSADLNLLIPSIHPGVLPSPRRWIGQSMWSAGRNVLDAEVARLNVRRAECGTAAIPTPAAVQQARVRSDEGSLEMLLARAARATRREITPLTLPALLAAAAIEAPDWDFDDDMIVVRKPRKLKIAIGALIATSRAINATFPREARTETRVRLPSPVDERVADITGPTRQA